MESISIEKIDTSNSYLRLDTDIESLILSIKTIGLIHPLSVDKNYKLIAGGRRYSALKELGHKTIKVEVIEKGDLEQELISIDENLVRTPLNKLELERCLNRGREIYEKLKPNAIKLDTDLKQLTTLEKKEAKALLDEDQSSFAAITSGKTGLSKASIQSAIKRDIHSSKAVKKYRADGLINASQTNEIIKLKKSDQEKIIKVIEGRPAKEIKKIVESVKSGGIEEGIKTANNIIPMPKEYRDLKIAINKMKKSLSKIVIEDIKYFGSEQKYFDKELNNISGIIDDYFTDNNSNNDSFEENVVQ